MLKKVLFLTTLGLLTVLSLSQAFASDWMVNEYGVRKLLIVTNETQGELNSKSVNHESLDVLNVETTIRNWTLDPIKGFQFTVNLGDTLNYVSVNSLPANAYLKGGNVVFSEVQTIESGESVTKSFKVVVKANSDKKEVKGSIKFAEQTAKLNFTLSPKVIVASTVVTPVKTTEQEVTATVAESKASDPTVTIATESSVKTVIKAVKLPTTGAGVVLPLAFALITGFAVRKKQ